MGVTSSVFSSTVSPGQNCGGASTTATSYNAFPPPATTLTSTTYYVVTTVCDRQNACYYNANGPGPGTCGVSTFADLCGPGSSCSIGSTCFTTDYGNGYGAVSSCSRTGTMGARGPGRVKRQMHQVALGACRAGTTTCPGHYASACIDLQTNLENCGACGNDCSAVDGGLGSMICIAGKCMATHQIPASLVVPARAPAKIQPERGTLSADLPHPKTRRGKKSKVKKRSS